MNSIADGQQLGIFALVSYVADPLGSFLKQLRQSLPGDDIPQPHITVLPPRPLSLPLGSASQKAREKLEGVACFDVELGEVKLFPETNVLFLEIADGVSHLETLHNLLNTGDLYDDERFPYFPHLTLSGPVSGDDVDSGREKAEELWRGGSVSRRFTLHDVSFVWQRHGDNDRQWQRLWTMRLIEPCERAAGQV